MSSAKTSLESAIELLENELSIQDLIEDEQIIARAIELIKDAIFSIQDEA